MSFLYVIWKGQDWHDLTLDREKTLDLLKFLFIKVWRDGEELGRGMGP